MTDNACGQRRLPRTWLLAVVAGVALMTAACSPHGSPAGAAGQHGGQSPAGGGSGGSGAAQPTGGAAQQLAHWAVCIRSHGDPNQADPTIDSNNDIEISMTNVSAELSGEVHGSTGPCSNYLLAAEKALRHGQPPLRTPSVAQDVKFAICMRANGVPGFPDPGQNGQTDVGNLDPNGPVFQSATRTCDKQTGETYYPPGQEAPGIVIVRSCNPPPGKRCPAVLPGG